MNVPDVPMCFLGISHSLAKNLSQKLFMLAFEKVTLPICIVRTRKLTLARRHKPSISLLWPTPDDFTR